MRRTILLLFLLSLIFTRFYNLALTTRFTRDESSNLVDMHRIFVDRQVTLIGPIDATSTIIYPSLTFYMLMPFAIIGNFTPASPATGTAFFGVLTSLLLVFLVGRRKPFVGLVGALSVFWYPLVESARWAWNPHLVPFVSVIGLILWFRKEKISKLLAGIFFGLAFHLHYLVVVPFVIFGLGNLIVSFKSKKQIIDLCLLGFGFGLMIIPFVIFDLRNPPGLFFGRFLNNNMVSQGFSMELALLPQSFAANLWKTLLYITQYKVLAVCLGISSLLLFIGDIKKTRKSLIYIAPVLVQIAAISFLVNFGGRYFLLVSVFFVLWLVEKRESWETRVAQFALLIMIIGGLISLPRQLSEPPLAPGGFVVGEASKIIKASVVDNDRKNVNLAVIASPDSDPFGIIYRHTLLVYDVHLRPESEYDLTDNLFVISTASKETVLKDPANILNSFRVGKVVEEYAVGGTEWKIYLLNK